MKDYACTAVHFLAENLIDAGITGSSQWIKGSTPVDPHSGEDWRTGIYLFRWGFLQALQHWSAELFRNACLFRAGHFNGKERRARSVIYRRPVLAYRSEDEGYEINSCLSNPGYKTEVGNFQIFVNLPSGKTLMLWVIAEDTGETLKTLIVQKEGYPPTLFYILHEGKVLHEGKKLRDCHINKNSTLHVRYRLQGE